MRALVVEDDAGIAGGLQASLKQAGYAVDVCGTLASAWSALSVEPFDVMLLDLGLPDGDGLDLLARVRRQPAPEAGRARWPRPDMPVLIMTARDGVSEAEFVAMRHRRDATLAMPTLILPSVQVNVRAGKLPPAANDGRTYVQLPINAFLRHGQRAPDGVEA